MASSQPKDVNGFLGRREQARGHADKYPQPGTLDLSHGQTPRVLAPGFQQQGPKFNPNADIAVRRQQNRQEIGNELRIVGPPTIYNPDELLPKKLSATTLIEKAQKASYRDPAEDIAALASQVASFEPSTKHTVGTFDDSETIMTTDTNYVDRDEKYNQYPVALATDYNKRDPASNLNLKHVSSDHADQMRGQVMPEEEDEEDVVGGGKHEQAQIRDSSDGLEPDWRELAAAEKQRFYAQYQQQPAEPLAGHDNYAGATRYEQFGDAESNYYDHGYYDVDDCEFQAGPPRGWVDNADAGARTPTQAKSMTGQTKQMSQTSFERQSAEIVGGLRGREALSKIHTRNAGFSQPSAGEGHIGKPANHIKNNTAPNAMAPPPKPVAATKKVDKGKQAVRNLDFAIPMRSATPPTSHTETKATSFGSSSPSQASEDELALLHTATPTFHKRNFEESLDYARDQLANMSYTDLDTKLFLADSSELPREPACDQNGIELTLEQKLSKMTDMSEEQCKAMFASMNDADNEGAGEWFVTKMKEDMEKLMLAKHKRRMIALKYEHEIKKRNAMVKAKTKDVEDELAGLKSGLGNLMPQTKKDRRELAKAEKKAAKKGGL